MLNDLIAKLEAATQGSRALDAEIAAVVGMPQHADDPQWQVVPSRFQARFSSLEMVPFFTTSIDDALTLFPETTINRDQRLWWVDIKGLLGEWPIVAFGRHDLEAPIGTVQASSAPIAICIAALKARGADRG